LSRAWRWKPAVVTGAAVAVALLIHTAGPALANAPAPTGAWRGASDPLEPMNRGLYRVNRVLQQTVLRPVMFLVLTVLPQPAQRGLHNVLRNLGEPVTALNDLLQLKVGKAAVATERFASNSTLGVLGLFDVASRHGLPYHASDFGQTLGRYGVPTGPYLFVPLIGPSSVRDAGARFVNGSLDPFSHLHFDGDATVGDGRTVLSTVETQAQTAQKDSARDPYAATRLAYLERRGVPARLAQTAPAPEPAPTVAATAPSEPEFPPEAERRMAFASVSSTFFRPLD
jgi:phospholipid-binding lipoprotein MlaA